MHQTRKELRQLVLSGHYKIKDAFGVEHALKPIFMGDVAELAETFGDVDIRNARYNGKFLLHILWLSLRKEGKTRLELDRGEYACSMADVGQMFFPDDLDAQAPVLVDFLQGCGLAPEETADPPTAGGGSPSGSTTGPLSSPSSENTPALPQTNSGG